MLMQLYNSSYLFEIDDEDFDRLAKYKWRLNPDGYVFTCFDGVKVALHRMLLGLSTNDGIVGDHIDGNTLNNRKSNLRPCSAKENGRNSRPSILNKTGYKGVTRVLLHFEAHITADSCIRIGSYHNVIHAAQAYDKYAMIHHKEFARLNFPEGHELYCKNFPDEYAMDFKSINPKKTSKYRGVSFDKSKNKNKWTAKLSKKRIGQYLSEIEAARAYDKTYVEKYGNEKDINFNSQHELYYANDLPEKYKITVTHSSKTSRFRGVSFHKGKGKWTARFSKYNLGGFNDEIEAAKAYNKKATEVLGDKAKLNIIEGTN